MCLQFWWSVCSSVAMMHQSKGCVWKSIVGVAYRWTCTVIFELLYTDFLRTLCQEVVTLYGVIAQRTKTWFLTTVKSSDLRSHTRCNVNLFLVNVIELCTVLYCTVLCCFIAGEWASVACGGASFLQSRPRDLPAARRTIRHGTDCVKRASEDPATREHCWRARF